MTTINQKEYLKKYLGIGKTPGEKKKKKKKEDVGNNRMKIIDDDADALISQEIQDDISAANEDAPQIVAVIDERPPSLRIDEQTKSNLWKPIGGTGDGTGETKTVKLSIGFKLSKQTKSSSAIQNESRNFYKQQKLKNSYDIKVKREVDSIPSKNRGENDSPSIHKVDDYSPPRKSIKIEDNLSRRSSDNDNSPPRRKNSGRHLSKDIDSDSSLKRRRNSDSSPSQKKSTESDRSPLRRKNKGDDNSPTRRIHKDDCSPPRRKNSEDNYSPPRRTRDDRYYSPTRKREKRDDYSPPKRKDKKKDNSPPRRQNKDDEVSGYKKGRQRDISLPGRNKGDPSSSPKTSRYSVSPSQQKNREESSPSRRRDRERDVSPPRKRYREDISPPRRKPRDDDYSPPRKNRPVDDIQKISSEGPGKSEKKTKKTLDGKKAGLQSAKELVKETTLLRQKEDQMFETMSAEVSGRNAVTVVREKKVRDLEEEARQLKKEKETKEKYSRWGKGLKQVEDQHEKIAEQLHEMSKPLARYADDEDLERYLKEQEREGDPMLAYIRKKKKKEAVTTGVPEKPMYVGEFMPNRFGIRPGYRWDGVDRSNGYEKKWFQVQNSKKATQEEAFKWSTEDM